MKKKKLLIFLIAAACLATACTNSPKPKIVSETLKNGAEDTTEPEKEAALDTDTPAAVPESTLIGTVTDGTINSVTVESDDGRTLLFHLSDSTITNYKNGLIIGIRIGITYSGEISGTDTSGVKVLQIAELEQAENDPIHTEAGEPLTEDQAAFAREVLIFTKRKDLESLADLCSYPIYVDLDDGLVIESKKALIALGADTIFTKELVKAVTECDISSLTQTKTGIVISSDFVPNITFQTNEAGRCKIIGINY